MKKLSDERYRKFTRKVEFYRLINRQSSRWILRLNAIVSTMKYVFQYKTASYNKHVCMHICTGWRKTWIETLQIINRPLVWKGFEKNKIEISTVFMSCKEYSSSILRTQKVYILLDFRVFMKFSIYPRLFGHPMYFWMYQVYQKTTNTVQFNGALKHVVPICPEGENKNRRTY